jgi:uncharacterized protein (TIGR03382 family)
VTRIVVLSAALLVHAGSAGAAPGDSCAEPIEVPAGVHRYSGSTANTGDEHTLACTAGEHFDLVYTFTITSPPSLRFYVPLGEDTRGQLRTACDDAPGSVEWCGVGVTYGFLEPGRYYLVVEAPDGGYDFTLEVPPIPGDTCADAIAFPASGTQELSVAFEAEDDVAVPCHEGLDEDRDDVVFTFTLDAPTPVVIDDANVFTLRSDCEEVATSLVCGELYGNPALPAGQYFLVLEHGPSNLYRARVRFGPDAFPPHATCAAPIDLTPSGDQVLSGVTLLGGDDTATTCGAGEDVVYRFTLTEPTDVLVETFEGAVEVRSACDVPGSALGCGGVLPLAALPAGEYHLVVDAADAYRFRIAFGDAAVPPGATCESPMTGWSFDGLTAFAGDDLLTTCGTGADTVHSFELPYPGSLSVEAQTPGTTVEIRTACDDAATALGCGSELDLAEAGLGRYYAVIESPEGARYRVSIRYETTGTKTCEQPAELDPHGTQVLADVPYDGRISFVCGGFGGNTVYAFTLEVPTEVRLDLTATGDTTAEPYVSVRAEECYSGGEELFCGDTPMELELAPGRYFLIVNSRYGFEGEIGFVALESDDGGCAGCGAQGGGAGTGLVVLLVAAGLRRRRHVRAP